MSERATTSTTIRVSKAVRDEIGALAAADHVIKDDGGRGNVGPVALARLRSVIADLLDVN